MIGNVWLVLYLNRAEARKVPPIYREYRFMLSILLQKKHRE